jgi:hypothetical protein
MPKQNYLQIGLIRIDGETQPEFRSNIDYVEETAGCHPRRGCASSGRCLVRR